MHFATQKRCPFVSLSEAQQPRASHPHVSALSPPPCHHRYKQTAAGCGYGDGRDCQIFGAGGALTRPLVGPEPCKGFKKFSVPAWPAKLPHACSPLSALHPNSRTHTQTCTNANMHTLSRSLCRCCRPGFINRWQSLGAGEPLLAHTLARYCGSRPGRRHLRTHRHRMCFHVSCCCPFS